jgi:hypothetical protein
MRDVSTHEMLMRMDRLMGTCACCAAKAGTQHDRGCIMTQLVNAATDDTPARLRAELESARRELKVLRADLREAQADRERARKAVEDMLAKDRRAAVMWEELPWLKGELQTMSQTLARVADQLPNTTNPRRR